MAFHSRDVLLVPCAYRDRLAEKTRPAVVVSGSAYNRLGDLVVAAITSRPLRFPMDYELLDWQSANLQFPSTVRMLATVAENRVAHQIGQLSDRDWIAVQDRIQRVFA